MHERALINSFDKSDRSVTAETFKISEISGDLKKQWRERNGNLPGHLSLIIIQKQFVAIAFSDKVKILKPKGFKKFNRLDRFVYKN